MQAPPVQRKASVSVEPLHDGCLHTMPVGYLRQAPLPSQVPSMPQLALPSSGQSLRGSVPTSAIVQVPTLPGSAQEWQAPEQSCWQQTPSKQWPLAQSPLTEQVAPIAPSC